MKKHISFVLVLVCLLGLVGCGGNVSKAKIDYGSSSIYSKEDMDSAIGIIKDEFSIRLHAHAREKP